MIKSEKFKSVIYGFLWALLVTIILTALHLLCSCSKEKPVEKYYYYNPYKNAPLDPRVCSSCHGVIVRDTSFHCGAGNFSYDTLIK